MSPLQSHVCGKEKKKSDKYFENCIQRFLMLAACKPCRNSCRKISEFNLSCPDQHCWDSVCYFSVGFLYYVYLNYYCV